MAEMRQQESIHIRGTNISQPNMYVVVTASAITNLDSHYILNGRENGMRHRMTQLDGVPASSSLAVSWNLYFTFWAPSFPIAPSYVRHPELGIPLLSHAGNMYETAPGPLRNLPPMTFPQHDDFSSLGDHHSDLDIEDMLYEEEVLVLDEGIDKGLLKEIIAREMKTTAYLRPNNLEGSILEEEETDPCIICQDEYKNREEIGILQCKHSYHVDCLKRWLVEKNVCPMCKSKALNLPDCFYVNIS